MGETHRRVGQPHATAVRGVLCSLLLSWSHSCSKSCLASMPHRIGLVNPWRLGVSSGRGHSWTLTGDWQRHRIHCYVRGSFVDVGSCFIFLLHSFIRVFELFIGLYGCMDILQWGSVRI